MSDYPPLDQANELRDIVNEAITVRQLAQSVEAQARQNLEDYLGLVPEVDQWAIRHAWTRKEPLDRVALLSRARTLIRIMDADDAAANHKFKPGPMTDGIRYRMRRRELRIDDNVSITEVP